MVNALSRGTLRWVDGPTKKLLRSRAGNIYDVRKTQWGWFIRKRKDELFQN